MPTPNERRALIFLAALGALGVGVRAFRGPQAPSSGAGHAEASRAALGRQLDAVDSATLAKRTAGGRGRGRRAGSRADTTHRAGAAAQVARGKPTSQTQDQRTALAPAPDPLALYEERRLDVIRRNRDAQARIERDLGGRVSPPAAATAPPPGTPRGATRDRTPVDLDTAGVSTIASLPWVGPALAARIVEDRAARGPFGSLAGFGRVRGVGPGLTARIGKLVTFSRPASGAERDVKLRAVRVRPERP